MDLLSGGATSFTGPTLTASAQSTSVSSAITTTSILDPTLTSPDGVGTSIGTTMTFGPTTILVGNLGLCQGIAPAGASGDGVVSYGCPGGIPFSISQGQTDYTTNFNTQYDVTQLTTSTENTLTAQSYNLDGSVAATSVTPEPSSLLLLSTGVLGIAGVLRKRFA